MNKFETSQNDKFSCEFDKDFYIIRIKKLESERKIYIYYLYFNKMIRQFCTHFFEALNFCHRDFIRENRS